MCQSGGPPLCCQSPLKTETMWAQISFVFCTFLTASMSGCMHKKQSINCEGCQWILQRKTCCPMPNPFNTFFKFRDVKLIELFIHEKNVRSHYWLGNEHFLSRYHASNLMKRLSTDFGGKVAEHIKYDMVEKRIWMKLQLDSGKREKNQANV